MKKLVLLTALTALLAVGSKSNLAAATEPPVTFFESHTTFSATTDICGFPVAYTVDIQWKARSFEEQGHSFTNVVNYKVNWTVTGNGRTLYYHEAYTETFFPNNDFPELLIVRAQHGLTFGIRLDGSGMVSRDAGTLIFLAGGAIAELKGPHPTELAGGLGAAFAEICAALAG